MKSGIIYEVLGWFGALAILTAYGLVSFNIVGNSSFLYHTLNLAGSLCIFLISFKKKAYQPVFVNVLWAIVSTIALLKLLF
uniref:CBU-0592-like domain-containing protein n=1 Tax=candidate division CPR3 bacterium TaxID=2268181 RepID=A0A7C5YXG8_UNCC3